MAPSTSSEPTRIFVSHSHVDNDFGIKLVQDLRRALGGGETAVWYDVAGGLHGGDAWWRKIVEEITARPIFLVVLSPDAAASQWVNDEIDLAWQQKNSPAGKLIVPVLYRDCSIRADLRTRHIVSFQSPKPYDAAFAELLEALGLASPASVSASPVSVSTTPASDPTAQLVGEILPQVEAAYAAHDWLTVLDKAAFLTRRAPTALPPALYRMQAEAHLAEGELAPARIAADAALALDALDVATMQLAATVRVKLGQYAEAAPLLQDALAIANEPGHRLALLRDYVGCWSNSSGGQRRCVGLRRRFAWLLTMPISST
jgi:hypothetical protein